MKCYLSIDFEDFSHDFKRAVGISADPALRREALLNAYEKIESFCRTQMASARLTFFCTGIIAKKYREIIEKISNDGHEIACHYFYHDLVYKDTPAEFEYNLHFAIDSLEAASNQKMLGFRAPFFSVGKDNIEHYKILERNLVYDSSLTVKNMYEVEMFKRLAGIERLALYPVIKLKSRSYFPSIRSGGSFLKLFPAIDIIKILRDGEHAGIIPLVYLHPYEFVNDRSFFVSAHELSSLGLRKQAYYLLRQQQWHTVGNWSVTTKLRKIFETFEAGGTMKSLLPT